MLGNALQNLAFKNIPKDLRAGTLPSNLYHQKKIFNAVSFLKLQLFFLDCQTCYDDILLAVADCFGSASWLQCIEDILGAGNPCIECVCEVIQDICGLFGCDWSC